tara:strand:+ start:3313 stop:4092 length:780 start_codon:yes stop_codon:yes gene_type:complete
MPAPSLTNPYTLTYSEGVEGWPSFYTYYPECIQGMNGFLYTFSGGNLFRHSTNDTRNNYYGQQFSSTVISAFNPEPTLTIKLFKTISFESNAAWDCTSLITDLSQGNVDLLEFEQKEGEWFGYVRHNSGVTNYALRYTNGLGVTTSVTGAAAATICVIGNPIGNLITIGATMYVLTNGAAPLLAGLVTAVDKRNQTVTLDTTIAGAVAPVNNDFLMFTNNTIAESYGMRGYYMEFTFVNSDTTPVELFSVGSNIMKSYP